MITLDDIAKQGDVLATFIWFAVLFTLSSQLNELGFMGFLGRKLAAALGGLATPTAGLILVAAYVLLHYLFVSQTAHLLALFGVFLDVGVKLGVNPVMLAFQLLFATNYFSAITPQGSSANLLFAGSGYLTQGDLYRLGAITTAVSVAIYFVVGTGVACAGGAMIALERGCMSRRHFVLLFTAMLTAVVIERRLATRACAPSRASRCRRWRCSRRAGPSPARPRPTSRRATRPASSASSN